MVRIWPRNTWRGSESVFSDIKTPATASIVSGKTCSFDVQLVAELSRTSASVQEPRMQQDSEHALRCKQKKQR